jgi:hypothetical protein
MRKIKDHQFKIGEIPISEIQFDPRSRDDIPQLLRGLQHIYVTPSIRREVFAILEEIIPFQVDRANGRPGMELWNILVLGTLRLNLDWNYDRLGEMANHHKQIRQMLGHGAFDEKNIYKLQTLKDNVSLLTPEILDRINQVVVKTGHKLVKKKEEKLRGRCDSFVVETDVHYPTDLNLLFDAMRKVITLIARLCADHSLSGWRQSDYNLRQIKRSFRKAQKVKHSTSKNPKQKAKQDEIVLKAHRAYLEVTERCLEKVQESLFALGQKGVEGSALAEVERFKEHAQRQINQIRHRVLEGRTIPHQEKVFSLFEEHTEWICKGKAGVPVELGRKICVMEDQFGFYLYHRVMRNQSDDQVAVSMVEESQQRFPELRGCSFDKGFHSPSNQADLRKMLDLSVLPKKGRLSERDKEREYSPEFVQVRRKHSAVESGINGLGVHGLDCCPDRGEERFTRYVALAVLARNIQKLGALIQKKELKHLRRLKKAA